MTETSSSRSSTTEVVNSVREFLVRRSAASESDHEYDGVLSYAAEWHSLLLGVGVGLAGSPELSSAVVAYALGRGGGKRLGNSAHVRDVADEPAYCLAGLVVGRALRGGRLALDVFPL